MIRKRTIVTLALAALALTAALLAHRGSASATAAPSDARPLLARGALALDSVHGIRLERRGEAPVVLVRGEDGAWDQVEPIPHRIVDFSARRLIVDAQELVTGETLPATVDRADLGLDPPLGRVVYRLDGGTVALRLGRRGIAGRAYLQVEGEEGVHVVGAALHERVLETDPREWRDRRLFPDASVDDDRIVMIDGDRRTELLRDGRRWRLESPARTRADLAAVTGLVDGLARAVSAGFILDDPPNLVPFGLDAPVGTLTVERTVVREQDGAVVREPRTRRLLVGERIGGAQDRFAMIEGRPTVVRLPAAALLALFRDPRVLADPTGSGVRPEDVKSIVIRPGPAGSELVTGEQVPGELELERDVTAGGQRWIAPRHGRTEVPATRAEALLHQLCDVRAPRIEFRPWPRELEVASITLRGFDGRPLDTIRAAIDPATGEWAIENGDDVLRVFPASTELPLDAAGFGL